MKRATIPSTGNLSLGDRNADRPTDRGGQFFWKIGIEPDIVVSGIIGKVALGISYCQLLARGLYIFDFFLSSQNGLLKLKL